MKRLVLAEDAAQGGLKSWSELLELDGVNKRVDGGVCVAKPEHKTGPAGGEGKLRRNKFIRLSCAKLYESFTYISVF